MGDRPWVSGPAELLRHGLEHLALETDSDRRIAMISIDNAVELMAKTYLTLPKRVTGIGIPEAQMQRVSFVEVISRLEETAADRLRGVDLAEIEWYHRRRNQLYHGGDGLTVEMRTVATYAELAKVLFVNLFGSALPVAAPPGGDLLSRFLTAWSRLERIVGALIVDGTIGLVPTCNNQRYMICLRHEQASNGCDVGHGGAGRAGELGAGSEYRTAHGAAGAHCAARSRR